MLMQNAVQNNDKDLQMKLNKAKSLLRDNIESLGSGSLMEISSGGQSAPTGGAAAGGDTEYTYQTEYNGEESFASGKNLAEIKDCIAEDIGVSAEKLTLYIKTSKTGKSKKIGSQKIFEAYLKMSGYSDEHVIEITNEDEPAAASSTTAAAGPRRKLFRHQCYGLSEDKIAGTTIGSSTWPLDSHI